MTGPAEHPYRSRLMGERVRAVLAEPDGSIERERALRELDAAAARMLQDPVVLEVLADELLHRLGGRQRRNLRRTA